MHPLQHGITFIYVENRCDKETYRALELGVRYDYNNEIETNGRYESTVKEIPAVGKI